MRKVRICSRVPISQSMNEHGLSCQHDRYKWPFGLDRYCMLTVLESQYIAMDWCFLVVINLRVKIYPFLWKYSKWILFVHSCRANPFTISNERKKKTLTYKMLSLYRVVVLLNRCWAILYIQSCTNFVLTFKYLESVWFATLIGKMGHLTEVVLLCFKAMKCRYCPLNDEIDFF